MSGNFWLSSQCKRWLLKLDESTLERTNRRDMDEHGFDRDAICELHSRFVRMIQSAGTLLRLRQRAVATAFVYFKRLYLKFSFCEIHPLLAATVCIHLATKVEECEVRPKYVVEAVVKACKDEEDRAWTRQAKLLRVPHMIECELVILQALNFDLIVFHPYRSLLDYAQSAGVFGSCVDIAWKSINDSFWTDACFRYPPHIIALAAFVMACRYLRCDHSEWLSKQDVDLNELYGMMRVFADLYLDSIDQDNHPEQSTRVLRKLWSVVPPIGGGRNTKSSSTGRTGANIGRSRTNVIMEDNSGVTTRSRKRRRSSRVKSRESRRSSQKSE